MFYTSMLMRMSPWDLGLLDSMSNILMIGDSAVALHLVKFSHKNYSNVVRCGAINSGSGKKKGL